MLQQVEAGVSMEMVKKSTDTINTSFTSYANILELLCITIFPSNWDPVDL